MLRIARDTVIGTHRHKKMISKNCLFRDTQQTQEMKLVCVLLLIAAPLFAKRINPESFYQRQYAEKVGGRVEVTAPDGTRCDILTAEYAIEADFSDHWAESLGQSLNYGFQFDRPPAILLIMEHKKDERYFIRLGSIIEHYKLPIKLIPLRAYQHETVESQLSETEKTN